MRELKWTDASIRDIELPPHGQQKVYTKTLKRGLALQLLVSYGGAKSWRVLVYRNSKPHSVKLGLFHPLGKAFGDNYLNADEADEAARAYYKSPAKFEPRAEAKTFRDIADNWLKRHVDHNKLRSGADIRRELTKYCYPKWGNRPISTIRRADVYELMDHISDNNGPAQADSVLSNIRQVMNWHAERDEGFHNPITRKMKGPYKPVARERFLSNDEIRRLWEVCGDFGTYGALLKVLLLTGQRREKVASMKWSDLTDGVWTIATAPGKMGKPGGEKGNAGRLKLPPMALEVINAQPRVSDYIFPGPQRAGSFNAYGFYKAKLDAALGFATPFVVHDLRRTARTLLSRAGISFETAERVLGHSVGGSIEKTYNQHDYFDEKAAALNTLAALIGRIVNPDDNVVLMRAV
jgi:integrase